MRGFQGSPRWARTSELRLEVRTVGTEAFEGLAGALSRFAREQGDRSVTHGRTRGRGTIAITTGGLCYAKAATYDRDCDRYNL